MNECEKTALIAELETKIKNVQTEHEAQMKRLNEIKENTLKLKAEEEKIMQQLNVLVGSYSAYNDSLKSITAFDEGIEKVQEKKDKK